MVKKSTVPKQTGDNPNQDGTGPNKGDLGRGDIRWVTPPPQSKERVNDGPETATPKGLSKGQRKDLARRIKAKLGLAASKRPS